MTLRARLVLLCLAAACGGSRAPASSASPAGSAETAVMAFLEAVADSNLAGMAAHWGTSRGSAAATGQPPDYERRVVVMQSYLANATYRILSNTAEGEGRRTLILELRRPGCTRQVPFVAVRTDQNAWVVNQVDLTAAGSPLKACDSVRDSA